MKVISVHLRCKVDFRKLIISHPIMREDLWLSVQKISLWEVKVNLL